MIGEPPGRIVDRADGRDEGNRQLDAQSQDLLGGAPICSGMSAAAMPMSGSNPGYQARKGSIATIRMLSSSSRLRAAARLTDSRSSATKSPVRQVTAPNPAAAAPSALSNIPCGSEFAAQKTRSTGAGGGEPSRAFRHRPIIVRATPLSQTRSPIEDRRASRRRENPASTPGSPPGGPGARENPGSRP